MEERSLHWFLSFSFQYFYQRQNTVTTLFIHRLTTQQRLFVTSSQLFQLQLCRHFFLIFDTSNSRRQHPTIYSNNIEEIAHLLVLIFILYFPIAVLQQINTSHILILVAHSLMTIHICLFLLFLVVHLDSFYLAVDLQTTMTNNWFTAIPDFCNNFL